MRSQYTAGFVFNLLQDVNILRPLIYLVSDDLNAKPLLLVTKSFIKRDKHKIWIKELQEIVEDTGGCIIHLSRPYLTWKLLNQSPGGFIIAASESNLRGHRETHELFKLAPSKIATITLQHGFECVGFLMNKNHQKSYGSSVGFAADYICGWTPSSLQRNLRPLQHTRYQNLGPTAWIKQTTKRTLRLTLEPNITPQMGIVCENLHSVRFEGKSNVNLFMQQFFELADYLASKGKKIALRPHPGGQYTVKNNLSLPNNVVVINQPAYKVNWGTYEFGISAPSSVLFDLIDSNVPVMVWQDHHKVIDTTQLAFLPVAHSAEDMISFANSPEIKASSSTNQQLKAILRDQNDISNNYIQFLEGLIEQNYYSMHIDHGFDQLSNFKKIRVLLLAPKGLPTVTLSFIKPLSLIPQHIEYELIHTTGDDIFDGETTKDATTRRCLNIINSFQPDILIMCRYFDLDALKLSFLCKKNGVKVIYHIDDLLYDPSPEVLDEGKYNAYRKRAPIIIDLIKQSDLVYCSTPALSKEISSYIDHPNIQHGKIYKSVDTSTILYKRDRKKVIGYTGFGHTQDLESIEDVILEVLNKYQDWSLELIGTIVPSAKLLALDKRLTIIPPERNYDGFISLLKSRNWSIGICPLINNRFNSVKANTKWVEYSCCNIATIATNLDPYCYGSPKDSLILCDSPVAWKDAFFQLMNSEDLVNSLIKNSQDYIRSHYSDEALSNQVLDICDGLMKN